MSLYDELYNKKYEGSDTPKPSSGFGSSVYNQLSSLKNKPTIAPTPEPTQTFGQKVGGFVNQAKTTLGNALTSFVKSPVGSIVTRNVVGTSPLGVSPEKAGKFVAKTGVAASQLFADTVDYSADFLSNVIADQIKGKDYRVLDPLQVLGKEKRSELADKWKSFYSSNVGNQTEALKGVVKNLAQLPALQPSKEWSEAPIQDKFSPKFLPETIMETGPGIIASLGSFAINPALGFTLATGAVANNVNEIAQKAGVPEDKSLSLGLGTGLLVGYLDKIVPEEILNQQEKEMFIGALAKKITFAGLKAGTFNVGQEGVQLAVESTLRTDLNFDEAKTRIIMSAFSGFLGGAGMQAVVGYINNVKSGDIAAIKPEDIKNPEVLNELDTALQNDQKVVTQAPDVTKTGEVTTPNIDSVNKPKIETVQDLVKKGYTPKEAEFIFRNRSEMLDVRSPGIDSVKQNLGDYLPVEGEGKTTVFRVTGKGEGLQEGQMVFSSKEDALAFRENYGYKRGQPEIVEKVVNNSDLLKPKDEAFKNELVYAPSASVQPEVKSQPKIPSSQPELDKINAEKVKNVTDVKSARTVLKDVQVQLDQAITEAEGRATVATAQREGINTEDVAKLKRIYAKTKAFQEGDIETIRASKHADLVNNVVENVRESHPDMTDTEALDYALNLPTKAQELARTPQIRELEAKQKALNNYIDLLKTKQSELGLKEDAALSKEWEKALATQEQLKKLVQVPSSQLPVGEGETKVSKLAARVKGVVGEATQEQIDALGLQTYNQMNNNDQIAKATDYVTKNTQEALKVINGEIEPPKGLLKNAIYIALTEAGRTNTDLATQIATMSSTRFGQEIEILKKMAADNPVVKMQEVVDARIASYEKRTGVKVTERVKSEVEKIKSEIKAPTESHWSDFLSSIKC